MRGRANRLHWGGARVRRDGNSNARSVSQDSSTFDLPQHPLKVRGARSKSSPGAMRVNDVIGIYMTYKQVIQQGMVITTILPVFQLYEKVGNPLVRRGRDGDAKPLDTIVHSGTFLDDALVERPLIQWIKPYEDPKTCALVERVYTLDGTADADRVACTRASVASQDRTRLVSILNERMLDVPRFRHMLLAFTNPHAPKMVAIRKYISRFLSAHGAWFADAIGFRVPTLELDMQPQEIWEHAILTRRLWEKSSLKFNFSNFINAMILAEPNGLDLPHDLLQFMADYVGDHGCPVCSHGCIVDACRLHEIESFDIQDDVIEAIISERPRRPVPKRATMALELFKTMLIHLDDHLLVKPRRQLAHAHALAIAQKRGYDAVLFEPQAPGRHCRFVAFHNITVPRSIGTLILDLNYCQIVLMRTFGHWLRQGLAHARGMAFTTGITLVPFPRPMREFMHRATGGWTDKRMIDVLTFIRMMVFNMCLPEPYFTPLSSKFGQHIDEERAVEEAMGMMSRFGNSEEAKMYQSKEPCFYMDEIVYKEVAGGFNGECGLLDDYIVPVSLAELVDM